MEKVKVLYCFDANFWRMAAVSVNSLLHNCPEQSKIMVYCLVAPHTPGHRQIKKIVKKHKSGAGLVWRVVKDKDIKFPKKSGVSSVYFYRYFAHKFFPDVDKMLYIDSDTLVSRDITPLYKADLSGCVIGAVRDMANVDNKNDARGIYVSRFAEKYLNNGPYFNGGVLLMDLKKLSEYENAWENTDIQMTHPNQDLLNVVMMGKIKPLSLICNVAPYTAVPSKLFPPEEAKQAINSQYFILHYYPRKLYDIVKADNNFYGMFCKYAEYAGMNPKILRDYDKKREKYQRKDTFIPHIKIQGERIVFFGMKI